MRSILAEVPQNQGLECVVQLTGAIESKQQAPELVFPAKHTLDSMDPLFENGGVEKRFAASLGGFSTAGIRVDICVSQGFSRRSRLLPSETTR